MLIKVLVGFVGLILLLVIVVALQPSAFRVSRSIRIAAPPAIVFSHVNDFHKWGAWSPWAKLDPNMIETHAGPNEGEGASYSWAGNGNVGEGRMTITECRPAEHLKLQLEFFKPFKGSNTAEFTFEPDGDGTKVTWSMYGEQQFCAKAMGLIINMDKMIGNNFEQGLAEMKLLSEKKALL